MGLASFNRMRRRQAELEARAVIQTDPEQEAEIEADPEQETQEPETVDPEELEPEVITHLGPVDYDTIAYNDLKVIASDRGIKHVGVKKDDLIEAIKASE
jgi:hypothetical protein